MTKSIGGVWPMHDGKRRVILYALRPLEPAHGDVDEQAAFAVCSSQEHVESFLASYVGVGHEEDEYRAHVHNTCNELQLPLADADENAHVVIDSTIANVLGQLMQIDIRMAIHRSEDVIRALQTAQGFVCMLTQRPNVSLAHRRDALIILRDEDALYMAVCYAKDQLREWAEQYAVGPVRKEITETIDSAFVPDTSDRSCMLIGPPINNDLACMLLEILAVSSFTWRFEGGRQDKRYRFLAIAEACV